MTITALHMSQLLCSTGYPKTWQVSASESKEFHLVKKKKLIVVGRDGEAGKREEMMRRIKSIEG